MEVWLLVGEWLSVLDWLHLRQTCKRLQAELPARRVKRRCRWDHEVKRLVFGAHATPLHDTGVKMRRGERPMLATEFERLWWWHCAVALDSRPLFCLEYVKCRSCLRPFTSFSNEHTCSACRVRVCLGLRPNRF